MHDLLYSFPHTLSEFLFLLSTDTCEIMYRNWFPFAKLLRNFCGTKRKIFLSLREKNYNLRHHSQKSFRSKLPYSAFEKLKFCAIPQFRKNQTVGDDVFLRIQFWKNLVLECLPIGHFYIIDQ